MQELQRVKDKTIRVFRSGTSSLKREVIIEVHNKTANRIARDCYFVLPQAIYLGDTTYDGRQAKKQHIFMRYEMIISLVDTFVKFVDYLLEK